MFEIPDIQLNQYGKPARLMFLAPYAPDAPDFSKKPYTGNGGYPQYHYNIYKAIQDIGYDVVSSSKPYSVQFAKGNVDYVFSLMNRFAMSRPEIFISSYCEFIQVPYLGAPPNIRAIAEDKFLTKMVFRSLELNVPEGIGLSGEKGIPAQAPFPGPYFVKKRFGAASGGIREDSICSSWKAVGSCARRLMEEGHEVLVEQYCEGIDVTVPVLGGENPVILGYVQPKSDKPGSIITEDLKLHDHLGYQLVSVQDMEQDIASDVRKIWSALGPMDYFRIDYRIDFETGERRIEHLLPPGQKRLHLPGGRRTRLLPGGPPQIHYRLQHGQAEKPPPIRHMAHLTRRKEAVRIPVRTKTAVRNQVSG